MDSPISRPRPPNIERHEPVNRSIVFLLLALSALLPARANAADNPPLVTLDTTELELAQRSARKAVVEFTIPTRLNVPGVKLRRWSISQDGRLIDRDGTKITFPPSADGTTADLLASFDLSKLSASGRYQAVLEFVAPKPPPRAEPPPAAAPPVAGQAATPPTQAPAELEQTVQLKLNRPAAELRVSSPLRLERTVYLPAMWPFGSSWSLQPGTVTITEATGKSWVRIDPPRWDVVLRHGDDAPEDHLLQVVMPDSIDGWGQGQAKMELDGPVSLGTTSGTLTIRAPQLAAQTVDFTVTLVSRVTALWLLPVILIGIGLGWYFRTRLEAQRGRLAAIVPAERELATLDDMINATADRTFRDSLARTRSTLAAEIEKKDGTPDNITAATTKAAADREAVAKTMSDVRARLQTSLQTWSRPGTVKDPLPHDVATATATLRDRIDTLTKSFDDGLLNDVDRELATPVPELAQGVRTSLSEWLRQFNDLRTTPPAPWPDTRLAPKLAGLLAEVDRLTQEMSTPVSGEAVWTNLISAAVLLGHCRRDLFGTVRDEVAETARSAIAEVRKFGAHLKPMADAMDAAMAALPAEGVAGDPVAVTQFADRLNTLRASIINGLGAAWNDAANPLQGLANGNFSEALGALASKRQPVEKDLGEGPTPSRITGTELANELKRITERAAADVVSRWKVILEAVTATATVSEPVTVRARLIVPLGSAQPDVTLNWLRAGIAAGQSGPGTFERSFTFSEEGPVSIGVVAVDGEGARDSATLILQVLAVHGARTVASVQKTLAAVERIQSIVAGAIITVAGWLIFSPSFVGTFPELFAAFLWGFSADVGAAKVRELTESVKGLKVPIPVPK
jgi:hypothetical protein